LGLGVVRPGRIRIVVNVVEFGGCWVCWLAAVFRPRSRLTWAFSGMAVRERLQLSE